MFTNSPSPKPTLAINTKPVFIFIPDGYAVACDQPFSQPPRTHSAKEAAQRDVTWLVSFQTCAARMDKIIRFNHQLREKANSMDYEKMNPD